MITMIKFIHLSAGKLRGCCPCRKKMNFNNVFRDHMKQRCRLIQPNRLDLDTKSYPV